MANLKHTENMKLILIIVSTLVLSFAVMIAYQYVKYGLPG